MAFPSVARAAPALAPLPYLWHSICCACFAGIPGPQEIFLVFVSRLVGPEAARLEYHCLLKLVDHAKIARWLALHESFVVRTHSSAALSSRGLGHRPLTAVTRVRIPLALPTPSYLAWVRLHSFMSWQLPCTHEEPRLFTSLPLLSIAIYLSMELLLAVPNTQTLPQASPLRLQIIGRKRLIASYYTLATPYYEGTSTEHCPSQNVTSLVPFRTLEPCQDLFQSFQGLSI